MRDISDEFVTYEQALALKELGFDEATIFGYDEYKILRPKLSVNLEGTEISWSERDKHLRAPLYQQTFDWLDEKFDFNVCFNSYWQEESKKFTHKYSYHLPDEYGRGSMDCWESSKHFETKKEARIACLDKLIEIVKDE